MNGVSAHDAVNYDGYPMWWVWMLEHGLDGFMGAVLAVGAVWWTLGHERRLAAVARDEATRAELRRVVADLQAVSFTATFSTPSGGPNDPEWFPWMRTLYRDVSQASALARPTERQLSDDLDSALAALTSGDPMKGFDRPAMKNVARSVTYFCDGWLTANPALRKAGLRSASEARKVLAEMAEASKAKARTTDQSDSDS